MQNSPKSQGRLRQLPLRVAGLSKCPTEDRKRLQNMPHMMGGKGSVSSAGGRFELGHVQRPQSESKRRTKLRGLHQKGWSKRRIARSCAFIAKPVNRYSEKASKCRGISIPRLGEESDSSVPPQPFRSAAQRVWLGGSRQARSLVVLAATFIHPDPWAFSPRRCALNKRHSSPR